MRHSLQTAHGILLRAPARTAFLALASLLLVLAPRLVHATGTEVCTFTAEADGVSLLSLPASRTLTITSASCTLTPPHTIGKMLCGVSESVVTPLGGTWDVTFQSESGGVVDFTTDDLSNMTMSPFSLCGFTHDVQKHTMTSQSFSYNDNTGILTGVSTDRIDSLLANSISARADKTGSYLGTITSFSGPTMTATFVYDGTWVAKGFLGALSPMSLGLLAAMLTGAGGTLLWRRRTRRS